MNRSKIESKFRKNVTFRGILSFYTMYDWLIL